MAPSAPVVLLTDYGLDDPFVGIVKGVLAARAPKARVIDLCHGIAPQDVRGGALALRSAVPYFPKGALFLCVVDPGVGSERRALWARSKSHQFLAPDNGLLSWLPRGHELVECRHIRDASLCLEPISSTFHGRDVFAPVAAALARGLAPARLGPEVLPRRLPFPSVRRVGRAAIGAIMTFDRFGNAVTNLLPTDVPPGARLLHRGRALGTLRSHYAAAKPGAALAIAGSAGFVELSVRDGDFRARRKARAGDEVHVRP